MGSTRLPGKTLKDVGGQSMLARVARRTCRAEQVSEVVVATTTNPGDAAIVEECRRLGFSVFRGDEQDVLNRYHDAAGEYGAGAVVRITSDCPLIDPQVIDKVITRFLEEGADYASNVLQRTYPRGLDTEVMLRSALDRAWREAGEAYQREHVTPYICENPGLFKLLSVPHTADYSALRWTVDTAEDLELVRAVYAALGNGDEFGWEQALRIFASRPELALINRGVAQKER